jgi:hypothetical protein
MIMRYFLLIFVSVMTLAAQDPQRIRVTVERQETTPQGVAQWTPVNAAHVFDPGEKLRFRFSSSVAGYLYVMNQGTGGTHELLFPRSDTGSDNRVEPGKDYIVPASKGWFRVGGPPGQDVVSWLVSPVDLGQQYRPLPPPPAPDTVLPSSLRPRCDDTILKARGDCIDTSAGVKPVGPPELIYRQENSRGQESVVLSAPASQTGPVTYELRLAHR